MSVIIAKLDGQEIELNNKEDFEISFETSNILDPNLIFQPVSELILPNLGNNTKDAFRIIANSISVYGIDRPIPLQIIVNGSGASAGFVIQDLFLNAMGNANTLNGSFEIINSQMSFFLLANDFDLRHLTPIQAVDMSDDDLRGLYDPDRALPLVPIATLRALYAASLLPVGLQINPALDYTDFYYLDKIFTPLDILMLVLQIFFVIDTIVKTIKFITDAGTTVSTGMIISTAIYLLFLTLNLFLLISTWLKAIPKAKKAKSIKINKLLQKACEAIGYTYISDFWNTYPFSEFCVCWELTDSGSNPIPEMAFSEFIQELMSTYNVNAKQYGNTVRFERLDYFWTPVNYIIPLLQEKENSMPAWNALPNSVAFSWLRDDDSKKKLNGEAFAVRYDSQYTGANKIKSETKRIESKFSRVYTKTELNTEEKIYNTLVDVMMIASLGIFVLILGSSASVFRINSNIVDCAQFDGNYIQVPKILLPEKDGRMKENHFKYVSAGYIYGKCHSFLGADKVQFYIAERSISRDVKGDIYSVMNQLLIQNCCYCELQDPYTGVIGTYKCLVTEMNFNPITETVDYTLAVFKNYTDPSNIKVSPIIA